MKEKVLTKKSNGALVLVLNLLLMAALIAGFIYCAVQAETHDAFIPAAIVLGALAFLS